MNRKSRLCEAHNTCAAHSKKSGRISIRWMMVIALVLAGSVLLLVGGTPVSNQGGVSMAQQMVWNPSPM